MPTDRTTHAQPLDDTPQAPAQRPSGKQQTQALLAHAQVRLRESQDDEAIAGALEPQHPHGVHPLSPRRAAD